MSNDSVNTSEFVCFGEILWDVLPTGEKPGGAPMNVAYHLKKFGYHPAIITRIGNDEKGKKLLAILDSKNINTDYVQTDHTLPTGIVHASPNIHGEMSYDIVAPVAWDAIQWDSSFEKLFSGDKYLVFGSLICRNSVSRNTLFRVLEIARNKILDINLRPPHFNRQLIEELMRKADIVKLNESELTLIAGWHTSLDDKTEMIRFLQDKFNIPKLIVTMGGDGAMMNLEGKLYQHPGYLVKVEDTVGSGDSFLAALLSQFVQQNDSEEALDFACAVGALVTSKKGGWPEYEIADLKDLKRKSESIGTT